MENLNFIKTAINNSKDQDSITVQYAPLVYKIARMYAKGRYYTQLEDCVQEGFIGLLKAERTFADSACNSFGKYARGFISDEIKRYISSKGHLISIPEKVYKFYKQIVIYKKEGLTHAEIAEKIGKVRPEAIDAFFNFVFSGFKESIASTHFQTAKDKRADNTEVRGHEYPEFEKNDEVYLDAVLEEYAAKLTGFKKTVFAHLLNGDTYKEIGEAHNLSRGYAYNYVKEIKQEFSNL